MGLIKAVDQFDPNRQVKFETYAIALIRGAILESLREEDWVPRSVRERAKTLERTFYHLEVTHGAPATEKQVAEHLGISQDDLAQIPGRHGPHQRAVARRPAPGGEGRRTCTWSTCSPTSRPTPPPTSRCASGSASSQGGAIDRLPERERLVIALYYYEGLTFKEIGKVLTVSESRVYQATPRRWCACAGT